MTASLTLLVLFLFLGICARQPARIDLLILNATVFDAGTGGTHSGMAVSIAGNRILDVQVSGELDDLEAVKVIDAGRRLVHDHA